jgi:hypothetical protein
MERRWLRLAQTYHDTDQLITAWLRREGSGSPRESPQIAGDGTVRSGGPGAKPGESPATDDQERGERVH